MKKKMLGLALLLIGAITMQAQEVSSGKLDQVANFKSEFVNPRNVSIWLPQGYSTEKHYPVLYMHDGQMLFDATTTWNKQEWGVDEVSSALILQNKVRPFIVVGVDNIAEERFYNYCPQKILNYLPQEETLLTSQDGNAPYLEKERFDADNYLRFLVQEVKPYIDSHYATLPDAENTFVMGSSMGGLISLYAICEYPKVFGGAAALSTHTPIIVGEGMAKENTDRWAKAFRTYLENHLPEANSHRIYMDYGDKTLDALYKPYQKRIDAIMTQKGWDDTMWTTRFFPGLAHKETDWNKRLNIPLVFLFKK